MKTGNCVRLNRFSEKRKLSSQMVCLWQGQPNPHEFKEAGKLLIEPNSMEMKIGEALKMEIGCKLVTLQGEVLFNNNTVAELIIILLPSCN